MARKKKTKRPGSLKKVAIYYGVDLTNEYEVDPIALGVLKWLRRKISAKLWRRLHDMMLGFNDDMQLEIANDLWDFTCAHIIRTTGCFAADTVLVYSYKLIAKEQGFGYRAVDNVLKAVM